IGKPILIAANKCDLPGADKNIERMRKMFPHYIIIPCSAEAEITVKEAAKKGFIDYVPGDADFKVIKDLNEQQRKGMDFLSAMMKQFNGTGVQKCLNASVFELLRYFAVFPGGVNRLADKDGNVLPDCFLLPPGSTAIDFARAIHTDFANRFIKAIEVRTKMTHGADWKLKHRDIVEFMFGK
ncbi:MAG: TGS domain-containing protein, partial [Candidatus Bilamarchaeaceae archaeon]